MTMQATETQTLTVGAKPNLTIRNSAGAITIAAGPDGQITLEATKKVVGGIFGQPKEQDLDKIEIRVTQEGDQITISVFPGAAEALFGKSVTVDLLISAPAQTAADVRLNAGSITLSGAQGSVRVRLNAGNVEIGEAQMANVEVALNAGNFRYQGSFAPDAQVDVEVNAGNAILRLAPDVAIHLDAQTTSGVVNLIGLTLAFEHAATLQRVAGATHLEATGALNVRVNSGNIDLVVKE